MPVYNTSPSQFKNKSNQSNNRARDFAISNQGVSSANPVPKMAFPTAQSAQSQFPTKKPDEVHKSFMEKLLSYTGGEKIAQGLGQGLAMAGTKKTLDEIQQGEGEMQQKLMQAIRKNKAEGKDTSKLTAALEALTGSIQQTGAGAEELYNPNKLTTKQVIGDALQLGTTVVGAGTLSKGALTAGTGTLKGGLTSFGLQKGVPSAVSGIAKAVGAKAGFIQGVKQAAPIGAALSGATGFSQGLKQDKSIVDSLKQGGVAAAIGGVTSGVLGGLIGAGTGALNAREANKLILQARGGPNGPDGGLGVKLTTKVQEKIKTDKVFSGMVKEAKKQGFNDGEINFLSTVSKKDKPVLKKMFDLTVKAQSDPRQTTRAGDILGENVTNQVKQVVSLNREAGAAVNGAAKALRGRPVDVTPLRETITNKLDDLGIFLADDGTLDFSQSVFKNTPAVQKEIQKVIMSVPDGSDAYQVHIFKKSIDELVDYGTTGEGLRGNAKNLLKSWRASADDILDASFDKYNIANTSFKQTKDYIDAAKELVGKRVDLESREGSQAFGQALRSAFSNNKSRGNTLKFIEETHLISKRLGLEGKEKNLLDQAIFVNMIEETFGSEAATGLAGEVSKAINKTQTAIDVVRNPISGGLGVIADVVEKSRNITPEAKKRILEAFIK